jgi:uncharacterized protein YjbI with pentapeptide repeats
MHGKVEIKWLPNIQYPAKLVMSPEQHTEPAGFGPIDFTLPQRFSKTGTYDDRWLKEDFPGFARDIDWTIFNLSQPDQWFDKPLQGDEAYLLENMHPAKSRIEGNLPGFAARCFISRIIEGGERFEEIQMHLSTVWFFPNAERAVLIFHGSAFVQEDDAADVLHIVAGCERIREPKGIEHYRQVLSQRLDKEKGHLAALRDGDLLPAGMNEPDTAIEAERAMINSERLLEKNLRKKAEAERQRSRALVASFGLDPDKFGPPPLPADQPIPDIDKLPELIEQIEAEAEKHKKAMEEQSAERDKVLEKLCAQAGMDFKAFRAKQIETPTGPPQFSAEKQMKLIRDLAEKCRQQGVPIDGIDNMLNDPERRKMMENAETKIKEAYRITAHHQTAAPKMSVEQVDQVRNAVSEAYVRGESFTGQDLTGADLSGIDLHGADFEEAFLESVDFSGANLTGCNFKNAVLAHSILKSAKLTAANLEEANIGGAQLSGADFSSSNLTKAILGKADLTGANFRGALLQGADCSGAIFKDADFSEAHAEQLNFLECSLQGIKLTGAKMGKCIFLKTDVTGVDFSNTSLQSSTFLEVKGKGAKFRGANLSGACFVQQCNFESADFTGACLVRANLRGSILSGCDFTQAQLDSADLSECDLRNAKFYRATAHEARFVKANLADAMMSSINAINAIFQRSDIRGADLRGANLFQADIARVHADTRTKFDNAFMKKVRIYPLRVK